MSEHIIVTLPAPYGGVNLEDGPDAPDNRSPLDALNLKNLYPSNGRVSLRGGIDTYSPAAGNLAAIRTLACLPLADGTSKLIGSVDNSIQRFDAGGGADITGTTTPTNDDWNVMTYAHRTWFFNGTNTPQVYNGSTVSDTTWSGVTQANLIAGYPYKERPYMLEKNTAKVWYPSTTQAVSGALTSVDFSYFLRYGGFGRFAGSFTNNTGDNSSNLFMFVSSEGEVLFYQGSYPGDTTTPWALVARYKIGRPLGYRAFIEVDNDVWILTDGGIVPVSLLFSGSPIVAANSVSRKVNSIIRSYAQQFPSSHLWHGLYWEQGKRVYICVPKGGTSSILLVCNIESNAWCTYEFTGQYVNSMAAMEGFPYFGNNNGYVMKAETGRSDDGENIVFDMSLPYSFFGSRGQYKTFSDVRPLMYSKPDISLECAMQTNFSQGGSTDTIGSSTTGTSTPWGSSWGSPWSSSTAYLFKWYGLKGQGHSGALRVKGSVKDTPLEFTAFDIRMKLGGQV